MVLFRKERLFLSISIFWQFFVEIEFLFCYNTKDEKYI